MNYQQYSDYRPGAGGTESCDWAAMLMRMVYDVAKRMVIIKET